MRGKKMTTVKIYSTPTCPFCQKAKEFLKNNNVKYEEFNVAEDEQARDEMIQKSDQMTVPVIEIDGQITVGFDEAKLRQMLKLED